MPFSSRENLTDPTSPTQRRLWLQGGIVAGHQSRRLLQQRVRLLRGHKQNLLDTALGERRPAPGSTHSIPVPAVLGHG